MALPKTAPKYHEILQRFHFLGIFVAKSLQDNRLVDLPLSRPLLKFLCGMSLVPADLATVGPAKATFLQSLRELIKKKQAVVDDDRLDEDQRQSQLGGLRVTYGVGKSFTLDELGLTFVHTPSSTSHGFMEHELKEDGADVLLTIYNVEEYVSLHTDFLIGSGVQPQLNARREGFCEVFAIEKLAIFTPIEILHILCGEQDPEWDMESLLAHTEPKYGYNRESVAYTRFLEILLEFDTQERKSFLNFATGCPILPPGGLANLHPRLTVVRKTAEDGGSVDGIFPSVNTCHHYVKIPDYSSKDIMRSQLIIVS